MQRLYPEIRSSEARPMSQKGLTLIEILVALLVLAVGLVGMSALTLQTLKNAHSSTHVSLASAIKLDLEERLWFVLAGESKKLLDEGVAAGLVNGCLTTGMVQATIEDLKKDWDVTNQLSLPGLDVVLVGSPAAPQTTISNENSAVRWLTMRIQVTWAESRFEDVQAQNGSQADSLEFSVAVPCRPSFN